MRIYGFLDRREIAGVKGLVYCYAQSGGLPGSLGTQISRLLDDLDRFVRRIDNVCQKRGFYWTGLRQPTMRTRSKELQALTARSYRLTDAREMTRLTLNYIEMVLRYDFLALSHRRTILRIARRSFQSAKDFTGVALPRIGLPILILAVGGHYLFSPAHSEIKAPLTPLLT